MLGFLTFFPGGQILLGIDTRSMAQTREELQREIRLLRKRVKEMEELLQLTAIKVEQLQGAYDTATIARVARKSPQTFELPPIVDQRL